MPKSNRTRSSDVISQLPRRLYEAAEAFYYAGILACAPFDAANVHVEQRTEATDAANAALTGQNRSNTLGAPPIVNFGFSIELYIKLLRWLADNKLMSGHDLCRLFHKLEKVSPTAADAVIRNYRYSRGDRTDFIEAIRDEKSVFEDWRYAFEQEHLISSADTLFALADGFRDTVRGQYPNLQSAFTRSS